MDTPHILFVVLDSARRDRVSTYGHNRKTTPRLDELATHATRFDRAYTPAPWTLPSHCSMFTGLYPSEHGITNGFSDGTLRLPSSIDTLTEVLSSTGYRTAGFSNNPWVGSLSGLDRGFDEFVEWDLQIGADGESSLANSRERLYSLGHSLLAQAARQPVFLLKRRWFTSNLVDRASRWIEMTDGDRPTFTFLNLMEAHSPYFPPTEAFEQLNLPTPGSIEPRLLNTRLLAYVLGRAELSPERRERVLEYYDASIRFQDQQLGRLLDVLKQQGVYDDTMIVICSDHGKTLGEFDRNETPPHYTRPVNTDVPLIVKSPGQHTAVRRQSPAELSRLFDVCTEYTDNPAAALCRHERALVEDFVPHTGRESQTVTRWRLLCDGTHRFIRADDGREFLFTPEQQPSPGETRAMLGWFNDAMDERINALAEPDKMSAEPATLSRSVESQLGDLGYLE